MRLKTYKMAMSILPRFLTLKWDISRTMWPIEVGDGLFLCIFHALLFKRNFFFDRRFPLNSQTLNKNSDKFPRIIVYGGMKVVKGKFGNYFNLDIEDDKTEEFFKNLEETLLRVGGGCLGEKPWNIKSPLINYGGSYTVRCKI